MSKRLDFLREEISGMKKSGLYNEISVLESKQGPRVRIKGKEVINLASNNYLGFANHPNLVSAARRALDEWGYGSGAVRQICGTMEIHEQLEREISKFKDEEACQVFVSGIAANMGTIQALMGEGDVILSDELNHGSIIDGIRLTKAEKKVYKHLDMADLEKILRETKSARRRLIVTDGVFSMDGDYCPLDSIVELAEKHDALVMVDDAHGDGVLGKDGRGTADHFGVAGRVDVDMGTLSKAFGSLGGFVAGDSVLIDFLHQRARSWLFTTSHPPSVAAASIAAIQTVQKEKHHLKNLWDNAKFLKNGFDGLGFNTGQSKTPITPVIVGESAVAQELSRELFKEGVFAKPIVYPLVAKDKARIRTIVTAAHKKEDLDKVLSAFEKCGRKET
ncbi:MAG: glycine C-acetyltransferase [Candidatus Aenigmarchaeota archaeon]|nr:glycine C-acetyltransferase [Candidatus Aenigmarchaeota archaeon]